MLHNEQRPHNIGRTSGVSTLVALLLVAACSRQPGPETRVGESEAQLTAQLGAPSGVQQMGNARLLTYSKPQTATIPSSGETIWGTAFTPMVTQPDLNSTAPETVVTGMCTTQYRIVADRVESWQRSGNSC